MLLNLDLDYLRTDKTILPTHNIPNPGPDRVIWTDKAITALNEIMNIVNESKLSEPIGYIVQEYVNSHYVLDFDGYVIITENGKIELEGEIKMLAYVCETYTIKKNKKNIGSKRLYNTLGRIINNVINNISLYSITGLKYTELYVVRLINEVIVEHPTMYTQQIIITVYFLTKYLIFLTQNNDYIFEFMDILITRTQELDISILTPKQTREIMDIFKTSRRLHLRIFLVLSYHMIREKSVVGIIWYNLKFRIKNKEDLSSLLEDVIIETMICLVANIIIESSSEENFTIG